MPLLVLFNLLAGHAQLTFGAVNGVKGLAGRQAAAANSRHTSEQEFVMASAIAVGNDTALPLTQKRPFAPPSKLPAIAKWAHNA